MGGDARRGLEEMLTSLVTLCLLELVLSRCLIALCRCLDPEDPYVAAEPPT